jgi:hypothetical protein
MRQLCTSLPFALLLTACGGPGVGDILGDEVRMTVTGVASAPETASIGDSSGGWGVTRLYVSTSSLTTLPCSDDASDIVLGARGFDLLTSPPPHETISTSVTELCGLRLDIDPVSQNELDGIPKGVALYAEGTDAEGTAFTFATGSSSSILLEAVGGVAFGERPLLLGFDVSTWLAGLPLAAELPDRENQERELLDEQTLGAFALYVDANDDQKLDEDEQTPVARPGAAP